MDRVAWKRSSELIYAAIEDEYEEFPLDLQDKQRFIHIVEFLQHHTNDPVSDPLSDWDKQFLDRIGDDVHVLMDYILDANYMAAGELLEMLSRRFVSIIKPYSKADLEKILGVPPLSPEKQEKVLDENEWILQV